MSTAFQADAFQNNAFQIDASGAVFPLPSQVLLGVTYGPTGADYTGTLVVTSGEQVINLRSFTGRYS